VKPRKPREPWTQPGLPGVAANDGEPVAPSNDTSGLDELFEGTTAAARPPSPATADTEARELAGRKAKRRGEALETWVRGLLISALLALVIAHWMQIWPEAKHKRAPDGRGGWRFELRWGARAHADFAGTTADGRSFAIECKTVEGARLPRARIAAQQVKHLDAVARAGGVALLALEFRDEGPVVSVGRQYLVPWGQVPWVVARSAQAVEEASLARWRIKHGGQFFEQLRRSAS